MSQIVDLLSGLQPAAVHRVLEWANKRYLNSAADGALPVATIEESESRTPPVTDPPSFEQFFRFTNPGTMRPATTLLAAFWLHRQLNKKEFEGYAVNQLLKTIGVPSRNITRDLAMLQDAGLVGVRKLGNSKQARKLYFLTTDGVFRVQQMIAEAGRS